MEMEEKLRWLEVRINSSLRARNEDIKNMLQNDENRLAFHEFINNEDVRRLFVYIRGSREILASLSPPTTLTAKSVFFLKNNAGVKLTKENMDDEVMYLDCGALPVEQLDLVVRDVYLPLMCTDNHVATAHGVSADKLLDILHRLMATLEVGQGHVEGEILLPLPSIEVLAEAAATVNRRAAVLHVLETTVISWIKQIKGLLKHDPIADLHRQFGPYPGPLDEVKLWATRLMKLNSINKQLVSPVATDILRNLEEANSTYAMSFGLVRKEINKAVQETEETLVFLSTMNTWFEQLHECLNPQRMLKLFAPLIHNLLLVWSHSKYYHLADKFHNLLSLISNEVVHRAEAMVGEDVLREPLESFSKLKDALRVCAAFRGTYLDYRDKAEEINEKNQVEHAEKMIQRPQGPHVLFATKLYGAHAYQPKYGMKAGTAEEAEEALREEQLWRDSAWPPRNAPAFDLLNAFMERCNDVLELVQTTRHFRLLSDAAEVGGAGSASLDALVKEIHQKYTTAMETFFSQVTNVLSIDGTQAFENAFFTFRTVVKDLERKLADVLRQSFQQCPTIGSQLRLLEVFEGVSSRELVQMHLRDKDEALVQAFTDELIKVRSMFHASQKKPPLHKNMPPLISRLLWIHALRERVQGPMTKMKKVNAQLLEGDLGWHLRDAYTEATADFDRYETRTVTDWTSSVTAELTEGLKQPLLVADEYEEEEDVRPQVVHVNLDPKLLLLLKEIHYIRQMPFSMKLPSQARELIRNTDSGELRVTASRLETIVSKYNTVMKTITEFELPLFERKLTKIDHLFDQGLNQYTWRTEEKADFIETATALVCIDLHRNLDIVQTNCHQVAEITLSWSKGVLDVFAARNASQSYSIDELISIQSELNEEFENIVTPSGNKIHALLHSSFEAIQMSSASPAWQDYVDYMDAIVLDGLKQASLTSLKSMLNQIVKANIADDETIPILRIRLELMENQVAFRPPLDESTSNKSVQETVSDWLDSFLARGRLVDMLGGKGSYTDYIAVDEEVGQLVEHVQRLVKDNAEECTNLYDLFRDYGFLWQLDVKQTFDEFLEGKVSPNPMRNSSKISTLAPSNLRMLASAKSNHSRASSAKSSIESAGIVGTAEKSFLQPKQAQQSESNVPTLDEFDAEIDIFKTARDEIVSLPDYQDVGWLRVDLTPIKQVLTTYASRWMWTFTKYLSDQVTDMLENLDTFLKRIEPEIEGITGEERDTASFMKMMRLFNEVSAQQSEMDGKFAAMHRTVLLVKKYGQQLPDNTQQLFDAAPARWNSLKTKVSLAKQRLGPRIQEESDRITRDLATFGERVNQLHTELEGSEVYSRDCSLGESWVIIDNFVKRLEVLENEAQDLIELQDLLETSVVNFSLLPQCHLDLTNLKSVWETVRIIDEQQSEWKRHRWQKMNTKFLREETNRQLEVVRGLSDDVFTWDVYLGLLEAITNIQDCLPLIDDLSNPAMRTRHWKQLVRVTGGAVQVDNDTLKRMTLGELLSLGLQKHVDDVRAIVQRAVKDLSIEQSLKTYEEVWLSKIFETREHVRFQPAQSTATAQEQDNQSEMSETPVTASGSRANARAASRISNQSSLGRARRASVCSLPNSLINLGEFEFEDSGVLTLLTTTEPIFDELESHQVSLQAMQSSSAAGSFLDEVMKWQKRLQTVEAVLTTWLEVQEKWVELEDVFSTQDIRMALPHDANLFSAVNRDFRLLMRATDKNPNVLQCCQRKNILVILEKMNLDLEHCRRSLLTHLERRRQIFPRFFFLSMEDVLHIICNGYDIGQVNLYIGKLLENVGRLRYEELDEGDPGHYVITGVVSTLGEVLPFKQHVTCEGQIESWLNSLLHGIRASLQYQIATAVGLEKPRTREIHSAGARRVTLPEKKGKSTKDKPASRSGSRVSTRQSPLRTASAAKTESIPAAKNSRPRSWILDHVTEVVYLVTQIQLTQQIKEALAEVDDGKQDALQNCINKVNSSLRAATLMLRGLEGDKEIHEQRERAKSESAMASQPERSHSAADTTSQAPAQSASKQESATDPDKQTIPEEGEGSVANHDPETASLSIPPADTMNLLAMPVISKTETAEEADNSDDQSNLRLLLFPSQIHKISSLIALLAHQRELLMRLKEIQDGGSEEDGTAGIPLSSCFDWASQLHYSLDKETRTVNIKCLGNDFEYGFEYIGSSPREVITPLTERVFLALTQAIKSHNGGLCMGPAGTSRLGTVQELGRALGKPLYTFNCTKSLDSYALHDVFKGFAATGSWICLNNINNMLPEVLSVCAQLVTAVFDAMRAGKANAHFPSEEVQLTPGGACFAIIDCGIKVRTNNPEKLLLYNSVVSCLSDDLLSQFRTVSMLAPDLRLSTEVMLISQGFQFANELAKKIILLFEMCSSLSGTNSPITNITEHLTYNSLSMSGGWSAQVLKYVATEAGAILDRMVTAKMKNEEVLKGLASVQEEAMTYGGETATMATDADAQSLGAEKIAELADRRDEEEAVVTALRNTFMPRLLDRDASIFATLIHDLWAEVDVPMVFGGRVSPDVELPHSKARSESRLSKTASKPKSPSDGRSFRESMNLNTPVVPLASALGDRFLSNLEKEKQVLTDINDAIAVATGSLGLIPGTTFQARVSQLAELNTAHKTVVVAGPPACGKSETIKTYALAERERGKQMVIQSIFTKSVESDELLGYWDPITKEWHEGLVPCILRKFCVAQSSQAGPTDERPVLKVLLLDGELDDSQFELMETILHNNGSVVLGNNERIMMPENLRFFWEVETLAHLTPAILANVGVLVMTSRDVGWRMQLAMWVERRREIDREILRGLCEKYVEEVVEHVGEATRREMSGPAPTSASRYKRVIWQSNEAHINTFTSLLEALINPYTDLSDVEVERYFTFSLIWSFGGTLEIADRDPFSVWWRKTFNTESGLPDTATVFDYLVDNESHQFVPWSDIIPSYSGTPHDGIPPDAFVHTTSSEQLLHLLGILTDAGKPVMLVGEGGCGKSSIVNERIRTVCSGEVAEVLGLTINTNRFTNARLVYQRLDDHLEWRHGRTYVPKGNKRLLCLIDDINLAQVDRFYRQSATELVRQHIDDGGFYDPDNQMWRYVKNVTYVTTINVRTTANVPKVNPRLLRHFAIFGCPYPSSSDLQSIFSILLCCHFVTPDLSSAAATGGGMAHHLGIMDETVRHVVKEEEEALKALLSLIVTVTLELQDRLRTMFLPTAERCHYMFVMKDLGNIFRNLCLSLRPGCKQDSLLLLWEHEAEWVYGRRLVNEIDSDRYRQAFMTAVRKDFTNEEHIALLGQADKPVFSNLVEQDSGLVTAGQVVQSANSNMTEEDSKTDLYRPQYNISSLRRLVDHGVEEYNKTQPRIKLALYRLVLEQVCRLARVIASPHQVSHCTLIAEGCPGRATIVANLAANLCGFTVFKINPSPVSSPTEYRMEAFKADLVSAYTRAGVKGERLLFLVEDEELLEKDFLVYLTEFIVSGAISHLFTQEEMTTIINSIRTEVTQAGLTYTRDVAWEFFVSTVRKNFRVCLITSGNGTNFQRRCREDPAFVHNVNFICFPHWTRRQLIKHAVFHLKSVKWMDKVKRENTAHLLATMHIVLRQQDGQEVGAGQYQHITNTTYEKFVERFISMFNERHKEIEDTHTSMENMNKQVQLENQLSTRLRKQLDHERVVLQERRAGTIRILAQIGQDTAITEQQIKIVKAQMEKISRLKKLLPEYQVAHERAVYKAIAIVADTKKVVQNMSIEGLSELRAMQKPTIDIEDLLAAVIMILKTPQADLTWQKGAKRQMANLERFVEELMSFDDNVLPESTLSLVEPYLKKASFDPENIEKKTNNAACAALCRWVRGVCRYNRMMISKVKPLHQKVEETTQAIDGAEHKMAVLDNKRKALEVRLFDLAKGFEEATIDKNNQEDKTVKMDQTLETAARLRRVLRQEQSRIQQVLNSLPHRKAAITGGVAMAAAFASYLGPYHYNFRRLMLTVHWPNCLRERGVPLVIDSVDSVKGRVVDWSVDALKTASGASGTDMNEDYIEEEDEEEGMEEEEEQMEMEPDSEADAAVLGGDTETTDKGDTQGDTQTATQADTQADPDEKPKSAAEKAEEEEEEEDEDDHEEEYSEGHSQQEGGSESTTVTMPIITSEQFNQYLVSLIKLLVGEKTLMEWTKKDFGPRQLENAAILFSSWQRPAMLIDPYGEGQSYLNALNHTMNRRKLAQLNMDTRSDPQVILNIEKCIMKGQPVLLANCSEQLDTMVFPIIHHRNTAHEHDASEEARMIKYCGRRILCHQDFRLYMATPNPKPNFSSTVASTTTLINYTTSNETLVDDLLMRAFARIRPELYTDRRLSLRSIYTYKQVLHEVLEYSKQRIQSRGPKNEMFAENDVDMITDLTLKKRQLSEQLRSVQGIQDELDTLRDELFPIARRGTMLYAILRSLATLRREYQFSLPFFMKLFDEAVGGSFPPEFMEDSDYEDEYDDSSSDGHNRGMGGAMTPNSQHSMADSRSAPGGGSAQDETVDSSTAAAPVEEEEEKAEEPGSPKPETRTQTQPSATLRTATNMDDHGSIISVPEVPLLPTEGVEYTNLPDNQIKQIVDNLTSLVYHRVKESLYEEHRLLFATLLCLNVQEEGGEHFSEEEISLLLQGVPGVDLHLTLADFECEEEPPSWLPADKWEDIMALSVMPGPLDGLCVNMAVLSEEWKSWYRSPTPEKEPLPLQEESIEGETKAETEGSTNISEFHQLLLLRMLRPDRLPVAMTSYINQNLSVHTGEEWSLKMEHVTDALNSGHHGVLVLLPVKSVDGDGFTLSSMNMIHSPIEDIQKLAESQGIGIEVVVMGEGREVAAQEAIDTAERENSWVVIDKLNLGNEKFFRDLRFQLQRLNKSRASAIDDDEPSDSKFCVWLTATPSDNIPIELLHVLYTLSWDAIQRLHSPLTEGDESLEKSVSTKGSSVMALIATIITVLLKTVPLSEWKKLDEAITISLKTIPKSSWDKIKEHNIHIKQTVYAVAVIQGLLMARQMLGTRGMSQFYPLTRAQLVHIIDIVSSAHFNEVSAHALIQKACKAVCDAVYSQLVCSVWDKRYICALVNHVLPAIIDGQEETARVGSMNIPTPPANVDPENYGAWFEEKMTGEVATLKGLNLFSNVERSVNEALSTEFLRCLENLYEAQNMDLGDIQASHKKPINLLRLRAILDSVLEQLPPLLDLGHVPEDAIRHDYDFPYHRPSVVSVASEDSILMPETIGFVLLQECMWLNSLLCHIRQNVHEIHQSLLAGPEAFHYDLREIIKSLDAEHVPAAWLHPNTQPSTHSLASWQLHMKKRYAQMHVWVKQGMVPIFRDGHETPVSHGSLRAVWLGGLVNPGALFTALCQEKAVLANTLVDNIVLAADVSRSFDEDSYPIRDEGAIYVRNLSLEGAMWDTKKNALREANMISDLNGIPSVYVRPILKSELDAKLEAEREEARRRHEKKHKEDGAEGENQEPPLRTYYECPVFMNRARQVCAFTLPMATEGSTDRWIRAGTALILDPGVPEDGPKKSRNFTAPKPVPLTQRLNETAITDSQQNSFTEKPTEEIEI